MNDPKKKRKTNDKRRRKKNGRLSERHTNAHIRRKMKMCKSTHYLNDLKRNKINNIVYNDNRTMCRPILCHYLVLAHILPFAALVAIFIRFVLTVRLCCFFFLNHMCTLRAYLNKAFKQFSIYNYPFRCKQTQAVKLRIFLLSSLFLSFISRHSSDYSFVWPSIFICLSTDLHTKKCRKSDFSSRPTIYIEIELFAWQILLWKSVVENWIGTNDWTIQWSVFIADENRMLFFCLLMHDDMHKNRTMDRFE